MSFLTFIIAAMINIIPAPAQLQEQDGCFQMDAKSAIKADCPEAESVAEFFSEKLAAHTGLHLPVGKRKGDIVLSLDPDCGLPDEGYLLEVNPEGVKAVASSASGLFYAMQSFLQLLPFDKEGASWSAPCVSIKDYPRFEWRGFHVDPCRHFISAEDVKRHIDVMAAYKLNIMHWHLTDDQGWRIEIKRYPELTEVGAWRREFDGTVYGGYYTQEEIADVVAYAAERFITVVPEIEMPGHSMAAIRAIPELSCTKEHVSTFYTWGSPDIVLCLGDERMFEFLDNVAAEVSALFPGEYYHIGGDECKKVKWEHCPACQQRIKDEGLVADDEFTAEEKLQSYAVHRMEKILDRYGKKLVGWDEILEGGLSPSATVMSWRGESGGIKSALAERNVVMTPSKDGMYFDAYQGDPNVEPVTIGNYNTLQKVYEYDPVPAVLKENGKASFVKGVQCNTWAEYIYDVRQREYMMFPRAFALAEIAWTPLEKKDFGSFCIRVDDACRRLDQAGVNYHIPLPEQPGGSFGNIAFVDSAVLELTSTRPMKIVYTLDGSEPSADSQVYTAPLTFAEDAVVKTACVTSYGKLSPVRTINVFRQDPLPAAASEDSFKGVKMARADGRFITVSDLKDASWSEVKAERIRDLGGLEKLDRNMPDTLRFYAAEAQAYFNVPETGVHVFSSDCDQVWIDDQLVIDNDGQVKRYSRADSSLALEKGLHKIRVIFIYNVIGGWNTIRNKPEVEMRRPGEEFKPIDINR